MKRISIMIRKASRQDLRGIFFLYKRVAREGGEIAKSEEEISEQYIINVIDKASMNGLMLVAVDERLKTIVGCIHAAKPGLQIFSSVMSDLTILVHPAYRNMGFGKALFKKFLAEIEAYYPGILRVELFCKVSNQKALRLYANLGFRRVERFKRWVKGDVNIATEADITMVWFNPSYQMQTANVDWVKR
jgi:ribosomal protein S18 acetylase RimI-like enzyme